MRPIHVALLLVVALVVTAGYLALSHSQQVTPELQTSNVLDPKVGNPQGKRGTMDEGEVGQRQPVPIEGEGEADSAVDWFGPPIRVLVRDQRSGAAIVGAKLMALGEDVSLQLSVTDARGVCILENHPQGLLLEVTADGYLVQRSSIASLSTTSEILLDPGALVRVSVKRMHAVAAEWPVRLALIPAVKRGQGRSVESLDSGWKGRLRKYLTSMDALHGASNPGSSAELRLLWKEAWGPKAEADQKDKGASPVRDRRFLSRGSSSLIRKVGSDGVAVWDGLPPGKGYRLGVLSGGKIQFLPKPKVQKKPKAPVGTLAFSSDRSLSFGVNRGHAFDLAPGEHKELEAEFVEPEARLRFSIPQRSLPSGATCSVAIYSPIKFGQQTSFKIFEGFDCQVGTNQRGLDLEGSVFIKFAWKVPPYRFRFRSYEVQLSRGTVTDLGSVAPLERGGLCRVRWIPVCNDVKLPALDPKHLPLMQISCQLYVGHLSFDIAAVKDFKNTTMVYESLPYGAEIVLEGIPKSWLYVHAAFIREQKSTLLTALAAAFDKSERDLSVSRIEDIRTTVGLGESLEIKVPVSITPGTEIRIAGLPSDVGRVRASLVGKGVPGHKLDVSVESGESVARIIVRGEWTGTGAMWLVSPGGRRAWYVPKIHAGVGQDAVAKEVKVVRVVLRVTRDGKPASSSMLMCNYSKGSGMSKVPGMMTRPGQIIQLDGKGKCTLNLPVGSTWSFSILGGKALSLLGRPGTKIQLIEPQTTLIELQHVTK